jgi:hypothetical protein
MYFFLRFFPKNTGLISYFAKLCHYSYMIRRLGTVAPPIAVVDYLSLMMTSNGKKFELKVVDVDEIYCYHIK